LAPLGQLHANHSNLLVWVLGWSITPDTISPRQRIGNSGYRSDCGLEEHRKLTNAGYSKIIALRDVRPDFTHADIPRLETGLRTYIKSSLIPVEFILAILEIEAWFLAESTHFPRIDPAITVATIIATLGFDPEHDDMSARPTPADDLNRCYAIGGKTYQKHMAKDTVEALDYALVYLDLPPRIPYLGRLIGSISSFLS